MSGGNSSNNGNHDSDDDESWGSTFLIVAGAAAATAALAGGLFALLKSSSSSNPKPQAPFGAGGKKPDDEDSGFTHHQETTPSLQIGWTKPELGWVKLNVDGSRDHIGRPSAGCGGVLRGESGKWLHGFAQKLDPSDEVHVTKIQAILNGLQLAWEMNIEKLVVESDHGYAVSMVENGLGCKFNHPQFDIISRIRQLRFHRKWQVKVVHIPREANRVANRLARDARDLPSYDLYKYRNPPANCLRLLSEDAQSGSYY